MTKPTLRGAISRIREHGALLIFPIKGRKDPLSLWSLFFPGDEMRWEWDEEGDSRVADLWHLREELSRSRQVIYAKWFQGRATVFSPDLFTALLSMTSQNHSAEQDLTPEAVTILDVLREDSPLPTKRLREFAELSGRENEAAFSKAMRQLWAGLFIVGFGEVDEGGFPSLAVGATKLLFEQEWEDSERISPDTVKKLLAKYLPVGSAFERQVRKSMRRGADQERI